VLPIMGAYRQRRSAINVHRNLDREGLDGLVAVPSMVTTALPKTTNDQILLTNLLEQRRASINNAPSSDEYFQWFVVEEVLRPFDLSYDELSAGIVDGGDDGGFDSIHLFINGQPIQPDFDLQTLRPGPNPRFQLYIIQAKNSNSFSELMVDRMATSTRELFDLSRAIEDLGRTYNSDVLAAISIFRQAYIGLVAEFPTLELHFCYASQASMVHKKVQGRVSEIVAAAKKAFPDATTSFEFLGARQLLGLARRRTGEPLELALAEAPLVHSSDSYICLVGLPDYFKFLSDSAGALRREVFESNVRDYEGEVGVNLAIRETLGLGAGDDFWWLNNGVTVIAERATQVGKKLVLQDPQIVNGLQTSMEIYDFYHNGIEASGETRTVLVRVLVPRDSSTRDRIIKATNYQTAIPRAALRATDPVQRDLEEYFLKSNLYYERRKNQYKHLGRSPEQVVSMSYVARAVISLLRGEPDRAVSKELRTLHSDDVYHEVFATSIPLEAYLAAVRICRQVEVVGRSKNLRLNRNREGPLFFCAFAVVLGLSGRSALSPTGISSVDISAITVDVVAAAHETVRTLIPSGRQSDGRALGNSYRRNLRDSLLEALTKPQPKGRRGSSS
jgi:AIPR protein